METLIINKDSPALNDFLPMRKMKYCVWKETLYNVIWEEDALEMRKNFIRNKKQNEKIETQKEVLSAYLKRKLKKSLM